MKRIFFKGVLTILFVIALGWTCVFAQNLNVTIPDFNVVVDNVIIDSVYSEYPFLVYNDITYFPMTWDYCRALNLTTSWVEDKGLYIAYYPTYTDALTSGEIVNAKYFTNVNYKATVCEYPIYVNGKLIDNVNQRYPLLSFNYITYFPMTWDYAHDEFNWNTNWNGDTKVFTLESDNYGGDYFYVEGVNDEYAKILKQFKVVYKNEDGSDSYTLKNKSYKLDYDSNSLIEFDEQNSTDESNGQKLEVTVKDNKIFYNDVCICEVSAMVKGEFNEKNYRVYGTKYDVSDKISYFDFTVYTNMDIPAPYSPFEVYNFVCIDNKYIQVAQNCYISKVIGTSDGCYMNALEFTGWKGCTYPQYILYYVSNSGEIRCINKDYDGNYGSIKLIGAVGDLIYVKATWCPEKYPDYYGTPSVSAINDGYFVIKKDGTLEKITTYIYADDEFISNNGDLYLVMNRKGVIFNFTKGVAIK